MYCIWCLCVLILFCFCLKLTFLVNRCNKDLVNKSGQTAHDIAKFWGHRHIARFLSSSGDFTHHGILPSNKYTENETYFSREYLNRMSDKRTDSEWLSTKQASSETVFIVFHNLDPFVTTESGETNDIQPKVKLYRFGRDSVKEVLENSDSLVIFLGVENQDGSSPSLVSKEDGLIAWFALNTKKNPTESLKITASNSFFLTGPMPRLLMLNEDEAGGTCLITSKSII